MAWRDQLTKVTINGKLYIGASFRGASFFVQSSDLSGGRLGEEHEFPFKEKEPLFFEDLGQSGARFPLQGYVLGKNYIVARDALIEALRAAGPGELLHPYHGRRTCAVPSWTCSETNDEGGMARFSIQFVETAETLSFPKITIDPTISLSLAGDAALLALKASFIAKYDPTAIASDLLTDLEEIVRDTARALNAPGSNVISGAQQLADFRSRLNGIVNTAASVVRHRLNAYQAIEDALAFAFSPPRVPGPILDLLALIESKFNKPPFAPVQTPTREKQAELYVLLRQATKRQVLVKAVRMAAAAQFQVFDDSRVVRDRLLMRLEAELADEGDDEVWQSLQDLRTGVINAIPLPAEQAQVRSTYTPKITLPSLVITHRLYGSTQREQEVVSRNNIRHPGFVTGGVELEVLTDA